MFVYINFVLLNVYLTKSSMPVIKKVIKIPTMTAITTIKLEKIFSRFCNFSAELFLFDLLFN